MWGRISATLKGWKTIIWSAFLGVLGVVLTALTALNGDMIAALLPDRYKVFSPLIYSLLIAIIGAITAWLRVVTTGPVGTKPGD